jgi:hypothetical protein
LISAWLTISRHCVDANQTYDVLLALDSEDENPQADTEDHDHATQASIEASHEITEVTSCHAHTDKLYCIADGEEWEVTTDVDVETAPDGYKGCHAHGEDELYAR